MEKVRISMLIFSAMLISVLGCAQRELSDKSLLIDETQNTESVDQVIPIDKVWAGHPVGFSLLTHQNRQYIAYYNSTRNMVVGQRNLNESKFELFTMPAIYRETSGGTSTVLGWDSHNSVTLNMGMALFL